jgi:hypothetical protein
MRRGGAAVRQGVRRTAGSAKRRGGLLVWPVFMYCPPIEDARVQPPNQGAGTALRRRIPRRRLRWHGDEKLGRA